jgi:hypothetical protein
MITKQEVFYLLVELLIQQNNKKRKISHFSGFLSRLSGFRCC